MKLYIIGSLRNERLTEVSKALRDTGIDVFDDWHAAGPMADDEWRRYEKDRGRTYAEALNGLAAQHVFAFDKYHLDTCDMALLMMPAGKSGHLELGYAIGQGKPGFILFDAEPERWDLMYKFSAGVAFSLAELFPMIAMYQHRITTGV